MARKRMFSRDVIQTEWFTDMPATAQMLYVHLSMDADDDGFVLNAKTAMINSHASKDDLSILLAKHYVLKVEEGLYLIKHWRQNNYIQNDRKHRSDYADRLANYGIKEDGSYTLKADGGTYGEIGECHRDKKPLEGARLARYEAKKSSELPYSFDYKIRRAFNGKTCPICGVTMLQAKEYSSPTIQHNVPISMGGRHEITNISVICRHCNTSIQNRQVTGPLNNEEVQRVWNEIVNENGNVSGMDTENSVDLEESRLESSEEEKRIDEKQYEEKIKKCACESIYSQQDFMNGNGPMDRCEEMIARKRRGEPIPQEWEKTIEFYEKLKAEGNLPF